MISEGLTISAGNTIKCAHCKKEHKWKGYKTGRNDIGGFDSDGWYLEYDAAKPARQGKRGFGIYYHAECPECAPENKYCPKCGSKHYHVITDTYNNGKRIIVYKCPECSYTEEKLKEGR